MRIILAFALCVALYSVLAIAVGGYLERQAVALYDYVNEAIEDATQ